MLQISVLCICVLSIVLLPCYPWRLGIKNVPKFDNVRNLNRHDHARWSAVVRRRGDSESPLRLACTKNENARAIQNQWLEEAKKLREDVERLSRNSTSRSVGSLGQDFAVSSRNLTAVSLSTTAVMSRINSENETPDTTKDIFRPNVEPRGKGFVFRDGNWTKAATASNSPYTEYSDQGSRPSFAEVNISSADRQRVLDLFANSIVNVEVVDDWIKQQDDWLLKLTLSATSDMLAAVLDDIKFTDDIERQAVKVMWLSEVKAIVEGFSATGSTIRAGLNIGDENFMLDRAIARINNIIEKSFGNNDIAVTIIGKTFVITTKEIVDQELDRLALVDTNVDKDSETDIDGIYELEDEENLELSGETIIRGYFDEQSLIEGFKVSKFAAGTFQSQILQNLMAVDYVEERLGAYIFTGRLIPNNTSDFTKELGRRFANCSLKEDCDYFISYQFPMTVDLSTGGIAEPTPEVVIYPKSWKPISLRNFEDSWTITVRNIFDSLAIFTSAAFAAGCLNLFDSSGQIFSGDNLQPLIDTFCNLSAISLLLPSLGLLIEVFYGKAFKGIDMIGFSLPAYGLPTFGSRVIYKTLPNNRNDVFDTTAVGIVSQLLLAILAMYLGINTQLAANPVDVAAYPAVSASYLQFNPIIAEVFQRFIPGLYLTHNPSQLVHLHWLALGGSASFIATCLQLLPIDNSPGARLNFARLGPVGFSAFRAFAVAFKSFGVILSAIRGLSASITAPPDIFLSFLLSSQISSSTEAAHLTKDNMTDLSEGRKIGYLAFMALLVISLYPFGTIWENFSEVLVNAMKTSISSDGNGLF